MSIGTAVVTGASSGIGAVFARRLAARGYDIIAHGRREEMLRFLCGELRERYNVRAEFIIAELSDQAQLASLERTIRDTSDLAFLVNNAGHGTVLRFHEEPVQSQDGMVRTHVNATVRLTHAALPAMLSRGSGTIVNVSSVAGFLISPGSAIYCATKAFLNSFSESLHLELRGTGVRVQALCPGFTTSDFHKRLGYDTTQPSFRRFMSAERVVDTSFKALERGTVVCIPGWQYKIAALAGRWIPRWALYRIVLLRRHIGKRVPQADARLSV